MTADSKIPPLGELHELLYRVALQRGALRPSSAAVELGVSLAEAEAATADLATLYLLRPSRQPEDCTAEDQEVTYVASDPDLAAAHLTSPVESQIRQLHRESEQLRGHVLSMKSVFDDSSQQRFLKTPIQYLTKLDAVRTALGDFSANSVVEVAAAHPTLPPPEALEEGLTRTTEVINRGVLMRTLYPHSVLAHPYMRQHLDGMIALGAQVRTTAHIPDRIVFFDVGTAVLADHWLKPGEGALVVRDVSLVRYLYRSWESAWDSARPYAPESEGSTVKDELRQSVLTLLESGLKDEVAARRLSMSASTYRRHVTELLKELGAQSRFQAGSLARRAGWLTD